LGANGRAAQSQPRNIVDLLAGIVAMLAKMT
jgi:hypothetical protein